jgi:hypothetical protein
MAVNVAQRRQQQEQSMADVTVRWAGPSDAGATSTYKIEYTLDNQNWTTLAAAQAATSPYVSPSSAVTGDIVRGATSITLTDASSFSTGGYGYLDDAMIQWTGKTDDTLTGVVWHSGYGVYASGSTVYEAHESATASGVTISLHAVLFRITHTNPADLTAPPAYLWYFSPPTAPANCCMVVTAINSDLGMEARAGISVQAQLAQDVSFALVGGLHLDSGQSAAKTQITNAFGLAFHACWRTSAREAVGLVAAPYTFTLDSSSVNKLTVTVATVPDLPWVLLSQIITGTAN